MVRRSATRQLLPERRDVERGEDAVDVALAHAAIAEERHERAHVRRLLRAEAPEAAAVVRRTESAAPRMGDRPEARRAVRDGDADDAAGFAFGAHARRRDPRTAS